MYMMCVVNHNSIIFFNIVSVLFYFTALAGISLSVLFIVKRISIFMLMLR